MKTICTNCSKEISNANYARHIKSCQERLEKNKRREEFLKKAKDLENGFFKCLSCGDEFPKAGIVNHIKLMHEFPNSWKEKREKSGKGLTPWNLGKETSVETKRKLSIANSGKPSGKCADPELERQRKIKISKALKLAHEEGRANKWSNWKIEESYPEKFFTEAIKKNFEDTMFTRELWFGRFRLDFAWEHKKKVIEIDGQQHERCEIQKSRDIKKDELLISNGWEILRIKWKDLFHNPFEKISEAKKFIDGLAE